MTTSVGFIGLGHMGRWMALNVLKRGFDLAVFDMDPEAVQFLTPHGARAMSNPAEMAAQANCVLLSLPDATAVEAILFGSGGLVDGARPGLVIVDCGTTSYTSTIHFAGRLAEKEIRFADAPVSGMEARAQTGTLTVMFGGDEALFEEIYPILQAIGQNILYMGQAGSGQLTKLTNQLLFNINVAALSEVLPMAAKLGLDPERVLQAVTTGTGSSFAAEFFGPRILRGQFKDGYPLKDAYKDMISAAEISAQQEIPLPLVQAATTTYQMALADGYGDENKGAMIKVFERLLGVEFRQR